MPWGGWQGPASSGHAGPRVAAASRGAGPRRSATGAGPPRPRRGRGGGRAAPPAPPRRGAARRAGSGGCRGAARPLPAAARPPRPQPPPDTVRRDRDASRVSPAPARSPPGSSWPRTWPAAAPGDPSCARPSAAACAREPRGHPASRPAPAPGPAWPRRPRGQIDSPFVAQSPGDTGLETAATTIAFSGRAPRSPLATSARGPAGSRATGPLLRPLVQWEHPEYLTVLLDPHNPPALPPPPPLSPRTARPPPPGARPLPCPPHDTQIPPQ
jgi:hypothetical protein